jgi:hypothetical protein
MATLRTCTATTCLRSLPAATTLKVVMAGAEVEPEVVPVQRGPEQALETR